MAQRGKDYTKESEKSSKAAIRRDAGTKVNVTYLERSPPTITLDPSWQWYHAPESTLVHVRQCLLLYSIHHLLLMHRPSFSRLQHAQLIRLGLRRRLQDLRLNRLRLEVP